MSLTVCSQGVLFGGPHKQSGISANVNDSDYATQGYTPNDGLSARFSRTLAPAESVVHEEFVRAAAEGQHTPRLMYLLSRGADIDARDGRSGLTALHNASFRGDLGNVQLLLASGADVNPFSDLGGTPICIAALRGHADVVETLLSHRAKLAVGKDVLGSAIHCACFSGVVSIFKSILDRGARLDYRVFSDFGTLSQLAKTQDVAPAVQVIEAGSRFRSSDRHAISCSPMLILAKRCHFKLLELCWATYQTQPYCLQDDIWYRSYRPPKDTWTASERTHGDCRPTKASFTLLMWAAALLLTDLVDYLLVSGANVNARDSRGWTALQYTGAKFPGARIENIKACVHRLVDGGARILLQHGADPNAMNVPAGSCFSQHDTPPTMAFATDANEAVAGALIDDDARSEMEGYDFTPSTSRFGRTREVSGSQLLSSAHRVLRCPPPPRKTRLRATQISKTMAWLLRHGAKGEGLQILEGGFLKMSDVLAHGKFKSMKVTFAEIREIVAADEKQRYTMAPKPYADGGSDRPVDFLVRAN